MFRKLTTSIGMWDVVAILYFFLMLNNIRHRDFGWVPVNLLLLTVYTYLKIKELKGK